jgi:hypothetical protein
LSKSRANRQNNSKYKKYFFHLSTKFNEMQIYYFFLMRVEINKSQLAFYFRLEPIILLFKK